MPTQDSAWYVDFFRDDYLNVYNHLFSAERAEKEVAFAELSRPFDAQRLHAVKQPVATVKLDGVTLSVVETERFDMTKPRQRPGKTGRGILAAGKQHKRGF